MVRAIAVLWIGCLAAAQTPPAPAFEVASVKRVVSPRPGVYVFSFANGPASRFEISGTRVTARGNLMSLVAGAYGVERFQVVQSPDWTDKWAGSEPYDIEARAPGDSPPTPEEFRQMMQALLVERFQLKFTRKTGEMPVYNLTVAPGGPNFAPTDFADSPPLTRNEGSSGAQIRTRFLNYSMADFANMVRGQLDRPLLDKTGLTGGFDFSLEYTWQAPGMTAEAAAAMGLPDPEPGLPIVDSIRKQLGLRVLPAKVQVDTLTVQHAERPSAN